MTSGLEPGLCRDVGGPSFRAAVSVTVHDGAVTGVKKTLAWAGLLAVGVALMGLGVYFGVTRRSAADEWGSVISAIVAVLGLPMTACALWLAYQQSKAPGGGQSVTGSVTGGGVTQVRRVRGNVHIGADTSPGPATGLPVAPRPEPAGPPKPGGQSVTWSSTVGPVRQIDDIGGDADIDR